jgi:chemotaxis protein MotB
VPRKKKFESEGPNGQEWMATYADTVTLLLTFFILLYSFSSVDAEKFKQIAGSLQAVLTGKPGDSLLDFNINNDEVPIESKISEEAAIPVNKGKAEDDMYRKVKEFVEENNLQSVVKIVVDTQGVVIQLIDSVLFESGSADIKINSKSILDKIGSLITTFPNEINVEGHTDNVPVRNGRYESNWELSTARAGSVLRYFVDVHHMSPNRFKASGYGEYKPIVPNDTPEHKAMNRRVHILIVTNEKENSSK